MEEAAAFKPIVPLGRLMPLPDQIWGLGFMLPWIKLDAANIITGILAPTLHGGAGGIQAHCAARPLDAPAPPDLGLGFGYRGSNSMASRRCCKFKNVFAKKNSKVHFYPITMQKVHRVVNSQRLRARYRRQRPMNETRS
jgi:hypothetical protein